MDLKFSRSLRLDLESVQRATSSDVVLRATFSLIGLWESSNVPKAKLWLKAQAEAETATSASASAFNQGKAVRLSAASAKFLSLENYDSPVFFRITIDGKSDDNPSKLEKELYYALLAASQGVGPDIHAAAIVGPPYRLVMVMKAGTPVHVSIANQGAGYYSSAQWAASDIAHAIEMQCRAAAAHGWLLGDIKVENMILCPSTADERTPMAYMIDFDGNLTFHSGGYPRPRTAECLLFVNMLALCSFMRPRLDGQEFALNVYIPLAETYRALLLDTTDRVCYYLQDVYIPERKDDAWQPQMFLGSPLTNNPEDANIPRILQVVVGVIYSYIYKSGKDGKEFLEAHKTEPLVVQLTDWITEVLPQRRRISIPLRPVPPTPERDSAPNSRSGSANSVDGWIIDWHSLGT